MSKSLSYEFAMHETAMATAPVFLVLEKEKKRKKLDVTFSFGGSILNWRSPDALGIVEQSVLLGLLSAARQQQSMISLTNPSSTGLPLISLLELNEHARDGALVITQLSWNAIVASAGYRNRGGKYVQLVRAALKRLAETTIWEKKDGKEYQSKVLAWLEGDKKGVTIVLNRRATEAIWGVQFTKISLTERHKLPDEPSKALHAWLCAHIRENSSRKYNLSTLQKHVWDGEASGSTFSTRNMRLRVALANIGALGSWSCQFISPEKVQVSRA